MDSDLTNLCQHQSLIINDSLCPINLHNVNMFAFRSGQNSTATKVNTKLGDGINCKQFSIIRRSGGMAPGSCCVLSLCLVNQYFSWSIKISYNSCLPGEISYGGPLPLPVSYPTINCGNLWGCLHLFSVFRYLHCTTLRQLINNKEHLRNYNILEVPTET